MNILDYFRTKNTLQLRVTVLGDELQEVRDECAALADERDRLAAALEQATRERDGVWRAFALEETRPLPAVPADASERAAVMRERERADALARRLQTLQIANMRADIPV